MTSERSGERNAEEVEKVINNFVVCGRCSFFLADYRARHGDEALRDAARESDGKWLVLEWDRTMRQVLQKSYGGRLDRSLYYYDSQCPECRRRFVYRAGDEEEGQLEKFQIRLKAPAAGGR